jgi:signal transduction histidine kinase
MSTDAQMKLSLHPYSNDIHGALPKTCLCTWTKHYLPKRERTVPKTISAYRKRLGIILADIQAAWESGFKYRHTQATGMILAQMAANPIWTANEALPIIREFVSARGICGLDGLLLSAMSAAAATNGRQFSLTAAVCASPQIGSESRCRADFGIFFVDIGKPVGGLRRRRPLTGTASKSADATGPSITIQWLMSVFPDSFRSLLFAGGALDGILVRRRADFGAAIRACGSEELQAIPPANRKALYEMSEEQCVRSWAAVCWLAAYEMQGSRAGTLSRLFCGASTEVEPNGGATSAGVTGGGETDMGSTAGGRATGSCDNGGYQCGIVDGDCESVDVNSGDTPDATTEPGSARPGESVFGAFGIVAKIFAKGPPTNRPMDCEILGGGNTLITVKQVNPTLDEKMSKRLRREIAKRRQAEKKLLENERMVTIGVTSAKLVHEIANPLQIMATSVELLEQTLSGRGNVSLDMAKSVAHDLRGHVDLLINFLSDFKDITRRTEPKLQPVNMVSLVREFLTVDAPHYVKAGIGVEEDLAMDLPFFEGDPVKLKQALLNLFKNAVEAMPRGGTLKLRGYRDSHALVLEVADTGVGIPEGVNIFDLFVTSKPMGTGLGLPIVQDIVSAHHGTISYTSERDKGTTFKLRFPFSNRAD